VSEFNAGIAREIRDAARGSHEELSKFFTDQIRNAASAGMSEYSMGKLRKWPEATYAAVAVELEAQGFRVEDTENALKASW